MPTDLSNVLQKRVQQYCPMQLGKYKYNFAVPAHLQGEYKTVIAHEGHRYDYLAKDFHDSCFGPPYSYQQFLDFMKSRVGISAEVVTFKNSTTYNTAGTFTWDNSRMEACTVFINDSHPACKQKITVIHEVIHAYQDLDYEFKSRLASCHPDLRLVIAERIAEITAVEVAVPTAMVKQDWLNGMDAVAISLKYGVSATLASHTAS